MAQKVSGPYGTFASIAKAARAIAHTRGPDFIKQYPNYDFPYNPAEQDNYKDHTNTPGHNNSTIHYIYHVIYDLIGSYSSGRRKPRDGWKRVWSNGR